HRAGFCPQRAGPALAGPEGRSQVGGHHAGPGPGRARPGPAGHPRRARRRRRQAARRGRSGGRTPARTPPGTPPAGARREGVSFVRVALAVGMGTQAAVVLPSLQRWRTDVYYTAFPKPRVRWFGCQAALAVPLAQETAPMANLNKVMLIGRLTRDPEVRTF